MRRVSGKTGTMRMEVKPVGDPLRERPLGSPANLSTRLEALETSLLSLLQEARSIKTEIQKQANGSPTIEPLLEAEEVAKILGVDVGYIYSQARAKKIPSIKLGKYRKFCPSQLKKWLDRKNSA